MEPEEKAEDVRLPAPDTVIPENWPRTGTVEFRNVTVKYDPEGPEILKDINLKFDAGQRVAVIGRTGSGKSTLVLSLLRLTHIDSGTILYDGVDITHLPRQRLRQALTIIPQEATLFNGTVESNLDPAGDVPREQLTKVLASCGGIASFQFRQDPPPPPTEETPGAATPEHQPLLANGDSSTYGATADNNNDTTRR